MHPLDYPGPAAVHAGWLAADGGWRDLGSAAVPEELRTGRTCVVAVGSNAAPRVLAAKLTAAGVMTPVAMVPMHVVGLAIAHSAHVSPAGYVATTPYAAVGVRTRVVASWFAPDQLAALDATEPNYRRRRLPVELTGAPPAAQAYVSRWGVLAPGGIPLAPATQAEVHRVLAGDPVLARLVRLDDGPAAVDMLGRAETRERVRLRLVEVGWVSPTGL